MLGNGRRRNYGLESFASQSYRVEEFSIILTYILCELVSAQLMIIVCSPRSSYAVVSSGPRDQFAEIIAPVSEVSDIHVMTLVVLGRNHVEEQDSFWKGDRFFFPFFFFLPVFFLFLSRAFRPTFLSPAEEEFEELVSDPKSIDS
jgi:hypothetical protein